MNKTKNSCAKITVITQDNEKIVIDPNAFIIRVDQEKTITVTLDQDEPQLTFLSLCVNEQGDYSQDKSTSIDIQLMAANVINLQLRE